MNKKGLFNINTIVVLAVLAGIIILLASIFRTVRLIIFGIAIFVVGIYAITKIDNKRYKAIGLVVLFGVGSIFVFASGLLQTQTGQSTYVDSNGNTHWLINGVATDIDEGYVFKSLPGKTIINGNTITPTEEAVLYISKSESYCAYQLDQVSRSVKLKFLGITIRTVDVSYYQLLSAERNAIILVRDDSGTSQRIDGTVVQSINFYDNGGTLNFKTLGILSAKEDCESPTAVALVVKDGQWTIYDKADYDRKLGLIDSIDVSVSSIFTLSQILNELRDPPLRNTQFPQAFDDYSINKNNNNKFIGDVEIGNVEYVIDADAKYYNSVVYIPPKEVKPRITNINLASDVKTDSSTSVAVTVKNDADTSGNVIIKGSVDTGSINPEATNFILSNTATKTFTIKAPNFENSDQVCFEVCSTSAPINCDRECKDFNVKSNAEVTCGNNICESFESFSTCSQDCQKPPQCSTNADCQEGYECVDSTCQLIDVSTCAFYETPYTRETTDCGLFGYKALLGTCTTTSESGCKTSNWVYFVIIGGIMVLAIIIILNTPTKKKKRK